MTRRQPRAGFSARPRKPAPVPFPPCAEVHVHENVSPVFQGRRVASVVGSPCRACCGFAMPHLLPFEASPRLRVRRVASPGLRVRCLASGCRFAASARLGCGSAVSPRVGCRFAASARLGCGFAASARVGCWFAVSPRLGCRSAASLRVGCGFAVSPRVGCRSAVSPRVGCRSAASPRLAWVAGPLRRLASVAGSPCRVCSPSAVRRVFSVDREVCVFGPHGRFHFARTIRAISLDRFPSRWRGAPRVGRCEAPSGP